MEKELAACKAKNNGYLKNGGGEVMEEIKGKKLR